MRARNRRGLTLLEVMVALIILSLGAAGWMALSAQSMSAASQAHAREATIRGASAELARASVWSHAELAARSGITTARGYSVSVAPIAPALWRVSVADTGRRAPLLSTVFYAAADTSAPR